MRMKFFNKEYQRSKIQSAPHLLFYRSLKHEQVTDYSRRDRLLSSCIINDFLKEY